MKTIATTKASSSRTANRRKSESSKSSRKSEGKEAKALTSRASPPPKDDFDDDVNEEAKDYASERNTEKQRLKIREENVRRKQDGLSSLKLPPKYRKEDKAPKRRRRDAEEDKSESSDTNSEEEWRRFEFEGQKILKFDPLPILAEIPEGQFDPEEIIREKDPRTEHSPSPPPRNTEWALPVELRGTVMNARASDSVDVDNLPPPQQLQPDSPQALPDVKPAETPEFKPDIPRDVKPDIHRDVKPDIQEDVKPDIHQDVKPEVKPGVKPDIALEADHDEEPEEESEEDYGDDDIVVVPWQKTSFPQPPDQKPNVWDQKPNIDRKPDIDQKPDLGIDSDSESNIEEQEIYSEDELFESFDLSSTTQPSSLPFLDAASINLLEMQSERPAFPCTEEQRAIGPFVLDVDDESMAIPSPINRFLREYQRAGTQFMYTKYRHGMGGILGDDMGLGKTVQVIAFLSAIMRKTGTGIDGGRRKNLIRTTGEKLPPQQWATALLVCPTSLIPNWSRELDTWGYFEYQIWTSATSRPTLNSMKGGYLDIVLVSHDLVHRAADELKKLPFSVVIVDEAHRMKKMKGRLSLATKKIPCKSCFALTGTLIQNRMDEMWSVLDFAQRGWVGTVKQWRAYAVNPINKGHRHDGSIQQVIKSVFRLGQVYNNILPHFYLRRDKRLIADELPKKTDLVVLCPLGARQGAVYKRIIDSDDVKFILLSKEPCDCGSNERRSKCCFPVNSMGDEVREAILRMFDALGRVANHMALLYQNEGDPPRVREINQRVFQFCVGEPFDPARHYAVEAAYDPDNCGKWNLLKDMLMDWRARPEENNKVLLFSNSVRLLKYIKDFIDMSEDLAGFDSDIFSGEVDKAERMNIVDRFQDPNSNTFVMLVSTMAGGVGLNLTAANKVIIFDPSWNPANDLQAMDRAFRFGQKRPVDVYRFVSQGTIEEVMYERQIYKQQRARQLNDGTFERRTHKGFEGATAKADKGELFGVHNIFRYDPAGYVKGNLERVRLAEAELRQDFIQQEYDSDSDDDEDEEGQLIRKQRRDKAVKQAALDSEQQDSLMDEILSDGVGAASAKPTRTADDLVSKLGLTTLAHNDAFRNSPEERAVYMRGIQVMMERPDLADLPANEIGKIRLASERQAKKVKRAEPVIVEEPWLERHSHRKKSKVTKKLVNLDDD